MRLDKAVRTHLTHSALYRKSKGMLRASNESISKTATAGPSSIRRVHSLHLPDGLRLSVEQRSAVIYAGRRRLRRHFQLRAVLTCRSRSDDRGRVANHHRAIQRSHRRTVRATKAGSLRRDSSSGSGSAVDVASLCVRTRLPGDRFQPLGMSGTKKLKDFMIDEKIPNSMRDSVPLIVTSKGIAWVAGWRIAEWAKVGDHDRECLGDQGREDGNSASQSPVLVLCCPSFRCRGTYTHGQSTTTMRPFPMSCAATSTYTTGYQNWASTWERSRRTSLRSPTRTLRTWCSTRAAWSTCPARRAGTYPMNDDEDRIAHGFQGAQDAADHQIKRLHWGLSAGGEGDLNDVLYTVKALGMVVTPGGRHDERRAARDERLFVPMAVRLRVVARVHVRRQTASIPVVLQASMLGAPWEVSTDGSPSSRRSSSRYPSSLAMEIITNRGWVFPSAAGHAGEDQSRSRVTGEA